MQSRIASASTAAQSAGSPLDSLGAFASFLCVLFPFVRLIVSLVSLQLHSTALLPAMRQTATLAIQRAINGDASNRRQDGRDPRRACMDCGQHPKIHGDKCVV
jgi:hypothetical protein